jgi:phage gpG-like protein
MEATIDLDLRTLDAGLNGIRRAGRDLSPVWDELAPLMKQDQKEHHRLQVGPDGPWPGFSAASKARRPKRKRIFSARMRNAFIIDESPRELAAIHRVPWAHVHQEGGTAGRGSRIPARPFIYMSGKFLGIAIPAIADHLAAGWLGRRRRR